MESYNEKYFDENINFSVGHGSTHPHQIHFEILSEFGLLGYLLIMCNLLFILIRGIYDEKEFLTKSSLLFIFATLVPILPSGSFLPVMSPRFFLLIILF